MDPLRRVMLDCALAPPILLRLPLSNVPKGHALDEIGLLCELARVCVIQCICAALVLQGGTFSLDHAAVPYKLAACACECA
eukprot:scaffold41994_cov191-Amphora_coffeaeformis.AAC.1